jgi:hypothetical protein
MCFDGDNIWRVSDMVKIDRVSGIKKAKEISDKKKLKKSTKVSVSHRKIIGRPGPKNVSE